MEKRLCSRLGIALIVVGSVFLLGVAAVFAASNSEPWSSPLTGLRSGASAAPLLDDQPEDNDDGDGPELGIGGLAIAEVISNTFQDVISYTTVISLRTGDYPEPDGRVFGWGQIFKLAWLTECFSDSLGIRVEALVISRTQEHMGRGKILHAVTGLHGLGQLDKELGGVTPKNLGQAKKCEREGNCTGPGATAVTSSTSSPGQGNAYGHNKEGNQGHGNQGQGNPHNGGNPGQGQGKGHDKGKKH
jgi:hypothetical protein